MPERLCRKCGSLIEGDWPHPWHVGCWPDFERMPGFDMNGFDTEVQQDLIEIVSWADKNRGRSMQVALGASEVGQECDLKLAYRMAANPVANAGMDPWPAIVGTSIHGWMEQAVNDYQNVHGIRDWLTELEVAPSPIVRGHTDLYHAPRALVLDWKFPGTDNLREMRAKGPSLQYRTQVHLYGLGHVRAGRRVERVGIAALGRQGWLKDLYVWTEAFDESFALASLQRIYDLGAKMLELGLPESDAWEQIPRTLNKMCFFCPYRNQNEQVASSKGCPGR